MWKHAAPKETYPFTTMLLCRCDGVSIGLEAGIGRGEGKRGETFGLAR